LVNILIKTKIRAMKNHFHNSVSILLLIFINCLSFSAVAQDAGKISGIKADEVWPVVRNVIKQKNLTIDTFDESKSTLVSGYEEYSASLIKNRAKYQFTYADGSLAVSLSDKQTLSTSGWAASVIPSKKADEKQIASIIEKFNSVYADKALVASLMTSQAAPAAETKLSTAAEKVVSPAVTIVMPSKAGAKQVKCADDNDYLFSEGLCAINKNELWGFIDTLGNWVIEAQYFKWGPEYPKFSSGICLLGMKAPDGYGNIPVYIDKKGTQLFKNQNFANASPFRNGIALVEKRTGPYNASVYSLINTQGVVVPGAIVPTMKSIFFEFDPFSDGVTKMWDKKSNSYGFIDAKGKWAVMPTGWEEVGEFGNGRVQVQNKTNFFWGYIDKKGATKIPFDYRDKPGKFSCGRALVKNEKFEFGYLDVNGNMALDYNYTNNSFPFHNGFAAVTMDNNKYTKAIIDTTGKVVREIPSEFIVNSDGNVVYGTMADVDYLTVLAPDGTVIIPAAAYTQIYSFGNNLAYARFFIGSESNAGFINRKGELVIIRQEQ
jgi:hypothetical protein